MPELKKVESGAKKLRANEVKWGPELVEAGWTMIPSTILERQDAIGLDPVDMNILLQLAQHWWRADNPPHPKIATIARRIKKSVSTVQRRVKKMERDGLIEIEHRYDASHGGQISSNYHFPGLIKAATEYAREANQEKEANRQSKAARLNRKVPRAKADLKLVDGNESA